MYFLLSIFELHNLIMIRVNFLYILIDFCNFLYTPEHFNLSNLSPNSPNSFFFAHYTIILELIVVKLYEIVGLSLIKTRKDKNILSYFILFFLFQVGINWVNHDPHFLASPIVLVFS